MNETLRGLRLQSGKSVAEVATKLNCTTRAIYNYERGVRSFDVITAWNMALIYGCTIDEFMDAYINTRQKAREDNRK